MIFVSSRFLQLFTILREDEKMKSYVQIMATLSESVEAPLHGSANDLGGKLALEDINYS